MKSLLLVLVLAALGTPGAEPVPIVQGVDATTCQWPSVVALRDASGNQFCTGTLVHPKLVITAGHCVEPGTGLAPATVAFGEDVDAPAGIAAVERCAWHPEYELVASPGVQQVFNDVAYCVLVDPIDELPIIPSAIGCEADAVQRGASTSIVGFGASAGGVLGGQPWAEGNGRKRWTDQTIQSVDEANAKATVVGDTGNSACLGDSGGPLFLSLADGTWRLVGVASAAILDGDGECGAGAIYQLVSSHVAWIEEDSGIDPSACFDKGGGWAPTEACGGFPTAPARTDAEWADACATGARGGASATCGAPFDAGTDDGSSSSTSSDSVADDVDTTTSEGTTDTGSSTDDGTSSGTAIDATSPDDVGCACRAARRPDVGAITALAVLVLLVRRARAVPVLRSATTARDRGAPCRSSTTRRRRSTSRWCMPGLLGRARRRASCRSRRRCHPPTSRSHEEPPRASI